MFLSRTVAPLLNERVGLEATIEIGVEETSLGTQQFPPMIFVGIEMSCLLGPEHGERVGAGSIHSG